MSEAYFTSHDAAHLATNPMGSGPYTLSLSSARGMSLSSMRFRDLARRPRMKPVTSSIPDDTTRSMRSFVATSVSLRSSSRSSFLGCGVSPSLKVTRAELRRR